MARGIFNPGDERPPKSRMTYIMLGIFLGIFGAHSFYAGFWKRGLLQLGLTLLSFFYASPITLVWAIAEVCSVDRDVHDVEFS
jgi:TM2 domain-containing membrane protein YozV